MIIKSAQIANGGRITLETRYGTLSRGVAKIEMYKDADAFEMRQTAKVGLTSRLKKGHVIISAPGFYVVCSSDGFTRSDEIGIEVSAGETTSAVTQIWKL